jgi:hypothetical protein
MSECVVRMEMPQRCDSCDFWHVCKNVADFGAARYFEGPRELTVGMKGCKIVCPLPEGHGRLVDKDALMKLMLERKSPLVGADSSKDRYRYLQWLADFYAIKDAKAIVPAERRETEQV